MESEANKPIRILILEDNQADAELNQHEIKAAGIRFDARVVDTEDAFLEALHTFCPDLILSDYDLPQYEGIQALAEGKKSCPNIHFILVTGAVTEDRAIEVLTSGARDYVLKHRLNRLVPAIWRALAESEEHKARKQAEKELRDAHRSLEQKVKERTEELQTEISERKKREEALRESEERFSKAFYVSPVAMLILRSPAGPAVDVNDAFLKLFGFRRDEVIGRTPLQMEVYDNPEDNEKLVRIFLEYGRVRDYEVAFRTKAGKLLKILVYAEVISIGGEEHTIPILIDITERVRAEVALRESEERFSKAFYTSPVAMLILRSPDGPAVDVNDAFLQMLELKRGEVIGKYAFELNVYENPKDHEKLVKMYLEHERIRDQEVTFRTRTGKLIKALLYAEMLIIGGEKHTVPILIDVTERARVEESLRESNRQQRKLSEDLELERAKLMAAIDDLPIAVAIGNTSGIPFWFNKAGLRLFSFGSQEEIYTTFDEYIRRFELYTTQGRLLRLDEWPLAKGRLGEAVHDEELKMRDKVSGTERIVSYSLAPVRMSQGETILIIYIMRDLTEQKQAEAALRRSEGRLRRIFDSGMHGVIFWTTAGGITEANDKFLEMVGYSRDELISGHMNWYDMTPEEYGPLDAFALKELDETGVDTPYEKEYIRKDGSRIPVIVGGAMLADSPSEGVAFALDITKRKKTEEALKESEMRYASLIDNLLDAYCYCEIIFDDQGRPVDFVYLEVNDTYERMANVKNVAGKKISEVFPGVRDLHPELFEIFGRVSTTGQPENLEFYFKPNRRWFNFSAYSHKKGFITFIVEDTTERKLAETEVNKNQTLLYESEKLAQLGAWEWDLVSNTLNFSDEWLSIHGLKESPLKPDDLLSLVHPEDRPIVQKAIADIKRGKLHDMELRIIRKDTGETRIIKAKGNYVRNEAGEIVRFYSISQDITDQVQARKEREKLISKLRTANQELESFSYSVSHDLRAPIRVIGGFSKMILDEARDLDPDSRHRIQAIQEHAAKMDEAIRYLLEFARSGSAALSRSRIDMNRLVMQIWEELKSSNQGRKMELTKKDLPKVMGDRKFIRQVLTNLLGNAVKFTRKREQAQIEMGSFSEKGELVFYIKDNGAGFDMKYYDKLFGVFQRLHPETEFEGTGVGLAIVQRIIHRHGGRIWAEGEIGKGATFYFSLPKQ
jgi:PAS domain S-box-containing protein